MNKGNKDSKALSKNKHFWLSHLHIFLYRLLQVSETVEGNRNGALVNMDCQNVSSPEMCPNTWMYFDENFEWKIDTELHVDCGKF